MSISDYPAIFPPPALPKRRCKDTGSKMFNGRRRRRPTASICILLRPSLLSRPVSSTHKPPTARCTASQSTSVAPAPAGSSTSHTGRGTLDMPRSDSSRVEPIVSHRLSTHKPPTAQVVLLSLHAGRLHLASRQFESSRIESDASTQAEVDPIQARGVFRANAIACGLRQAVAYSGTPQFHDAVSTRVLFDNHTQIERRRKERKTQNVNCAMARIAARRSCSAAFAYAGLLIYTDSARSPPSRGPGQSEDRNREIIRRRTLYTPWPVSYELDEEQQQHLHCTDLASRRLPPPAKYPSIPGQLGSRAGFVGKKEARIRTSCFGCPHASCFSCAAHAPPPPAASAHAPPPREWFRPATRMWTTSGIAHSIGPSFVFITTRTSLHHPPARSLCKNPNKDGSLHGSRRAVSGGACASYGVAEPESVGQKQPTPCLLPRISAWDGPGEIGGMEAIILFAMEDRGGHLERPQWCVRPCLFFKRVFGPLGSCLAQQHMRARCGPSGALVLPRRRVEVTDGS
ncbi:hypothetical protein C8J57DRAFT_1223542 [Mycena rebaudengoi]|nr:hypothetical protein C8J57DRAFT_1223542 [Mycena rebaudengoi]